MRKTLLLVTVVLGFLLPTTGSAGDLKVTLADGRATIIADDVPVRAILQEWARVGQSRIVNAEKLTGPPVTLRLINVPEQEALDVLLRSASGYVAAARAQMVANTSQYDRIVILAASRPASTGSAPAMAPQPTPMAPYPQNPIAQQPVAEPDDDEPDEPNPATARPPMTSPQPGPLQVSPQPGAQPQPMQGQPPAPMTAPRPGIFTPSTGVPGQPGVANPPGAPGQQPVKPGGGGE